MVRDRTQRVSKDFEIMVQDIQKGFKEQGLLVSFAEVTGALNNKIRENDMNLTREDIEIAKKRKQMLI